jgi:hypothetical protein
MSHSPHVTASPGSIPAYCHNLNPSSPWLNHQQWTDCVNRSSHQYMAGVTSNSFVVGAITILVIGWLIRRYVRRPTARIRRPS